MNDKKKLKLSQVVAIEVDVKGKAHPKITEIHKTTQKAELFVGSSATYEPVDENGEKFPPKRQKVQLVAEMAIKDMAAIWTELIDSTSTKDYGNCSPEARADVVFEGKILVSQAPIPALLYLEKQLTDFRKAVEVIPVLDEAEDWDYDPSLGYFRTREPVKTHKTNKVQSALVLYPATEKHPAQTQLITKDEVVGYWTGYKFSGALPATRKAQILERASMVLRAVKMAREEANSARIDKVDIGAALFAAVLDKSEAS